MNRIYQIEDIETTISSLRLTGRAVTRLQPSRSASSMRSRRRHAPDASDVRSSDCCRQNKQNSSVYCLIISIISRQRKHKVKTHSTLCQIFETLYVKWLN